MALDAVQARLQLLTGVIPKLIVADAHLATANARWAQDHADGLPVVTVQHHHAHLAAVMAEDGLDGASPVIGVAFDGTGHGVSGCSGQGESWGGEGLVAGYRGFRRIAHLAYVGLAAGDLSVVRPYRMALWHLYADGLDWGR